MNSERNSWFAEQVALLKTSLARQFVLIFGLLALVVGVIALLLLSGDQEVDALVGEASARSTTSRVQVDSLRQGGEINWSRFIDDVYSAHGGRAHFERTHTLRKTGTLFYGDEELDVVFAYKRPGLLRYRLVNDRQIAITFSWDGQVAWSQLERTLNPLPPRILQGEEAMAVIRNSVASRHFLEFIGEGLRPVAVEYVEKDSTTYIELRMPVANNRSQSFFLDPDTLHVRRNIWTEPSLDGSRMTTTEVRYDNYQVVDGFPAAHLETVIIDGVKLNRFEISLFEVNPGILNAFFSPPAVR
ncbi:MAG: hypothetical protein LR015_02430 [Verrucomicrobia bacterium]|nr:hypothetical protein [Verrucomicrobiota bacterium]